MKQRFNKSQIFVVDSEIHINIHMEMYVKIRFNLL